MLARMMASSPGGRRLSRRGLPSRRQLRGRVRASTFDAAPNADTEADLFFSLNKVAAQVAVILDIPVVQHLIDVQEKTIMSMHARASARLVEVGLTSSEMITK